MRVTLKARGRRSTGGRGAGLGPGRYELLLDHAAIEIDRASQLRAVEGGLRAVLGEDVATGRPDQRREGEDVAAAAIAGEIEALDVAAQRIDLGRVRLDFRPGRGSLFRIEARLLEEFLVPDQHRTVGGER